MSQLLDLKKQYSDWIMDSMNYTQLDKDIIRIDTPFLDNDFDHIVLYVEFLKNNQVLITDDGYTLANLKSLGFKISNQTKKRKTILTDICDDYGIEFDSKENQLFIKSNIDKFPISKHRLLQAILKINDLFLLRPNYEPNSTFETVSKALDEENIFYSTKFPAIGKRGITFVFDFSIPTRSKKDKLIRIINSPNDLNYSKVLSMDVSMLQGNKDADYFAILDDLNHELKNYAEVESVYEEVKEQYNIKIYPIKMSQLDQKIELLRN